MPIDPVALAAASAPIDHVLVNRAVGQFALAVELAHFALPRGWDLSVRVLASGAVVELVDPADDTSVFAVTDSVAERLIDAIRAARTAGVAPGVPADGPR